MANAGILKIESGILFFEEKAKINFKNLK